MIKHPKLKTLIKAGNYAQNNIFTNFLISLYCYCDRQETTPFSPHPNAQISEGMSYLEAKGYVHKHLAARTVLICHDNLVKISLLPPYTKPCYPQLSQATVMSGDRYESETALTFYSTKITLIESQFFCTK